MKFFYFYGGLRLLEDCFDHDIDYYGTDLKMLKTVTAKDCQSACAGNKDCVEFTWLGVSKNGDPDYLHRCYLKNGYHTETSSKPGFISGPKECGNLHY